MSETKLVGVDYVSTPQLRTAGSLYHKYPKHVVIDIETAGLDLGCPILTIGAITLDLNHQFYARIDVPNLDIAFGVDVSTRVWWEAQSEEAKLEAFSPDYKRYTMRDALEGFASFLQECEATALVGNGVNFDNAILRHALSCAGVELTGTVADTKTDFCYRTLKVVLPNVHEPEFIGTRHHALFDALHEARHLNRLLNYLQRTRISQDAEHASRVISSTDTGGIL